LSTSIFYGKVHFVPRLPKRNFAHTAYDPAWAYPFDSRKTIERLQAYFEELGKNKYGWNNFKHRERPEALGYNYKGAIPWESVQPQFRQKTQEWFDRKIAECKEKGTPLTQGKIASLRCNATRYGRCILTQNHWRKMRTFYFNRFKMNRYQNWLTKQQKAEHWQRVGPTESKQLEVA
jgi:hypothetical protein